MGWFTSENLRLVVLGLVVSAFMVMIYDISQLAFKIFLEDDEKQRMVDEKEIQYKIYASIIAVFIGIFLVRYFNKTHKATNNQ